MASEDVLERADRWTSERNSGVVVGQFTNHSLVTANLISDLAAEVRELRAENADLRDQVQTMLAGRMPSSAIIADVREFHAKFGVPVEPSPTQSTHDRRRLRGDLIAEEAEETVCALDSGDLIAIADGLADLIYVAVGTALELGIPLDRVWKEVHRSNMAKVGGGERADGKILKPEGWVPPDIAAALGIAREGEAMAKLYWAISKDDERWHGPFESIEDAKLDATDAIPFGPIWVAPIDAELDNEDEFWDALADHLLVWGVESAEETLVEDGWLDPEEAWKSGDMPQDRDRILARALREVLGPRPKWRTVDTLKAERVEL